MDNMKAEITESIWKKLEADQERRTVYDVPLINGTSKMDLNSLEESEKDSREKLLRNMRRKDTDSILYTHSIVSFKVSS